MLNDRCYCEVEFKAGRRDTFSCPETLAIMPGEYVMVEADRGEDLGRMIHRMRPRLVNKKLDEIKSILRKAESEEVDQLMQKAAKEKEALVVCKLKVAQRELPMKVLGAEYQFDRNKLTFYFTADNRIDFRELVRDLAAIYKTRIELRQIGVRDEAKRLGGFGICGRKLCCSSFLRDFKPISSQLVKEQNMGALPSKMTGLCGRLKCCLRYEQNGEGGKCTFGEDECGGECSCGMTEAMEDFQGREGVVAV